MTALPDATLLTDDDPADLDLPEADEAASAAPIVCTVPPEAAGSRLDHWLVQVQPDFSRARLQSFIKDGRVTCAGQPVKANLKIKAGQSYVIDIPEPEPAEPLPEDIPLDIVYEDHDVIVIVKPAGLVVHPAAGHYTGTLVNALLFHCADLAGIGGVARPGIVHRLDKDTSGLMVVAKNDAAMAGLVAAFKAGTVKKVYMALVHGLPVPATGTIRSLIGRDPRDRKKMSVVGRNGKEAVTHYAVERLTPNGTLVRCRIETGRTHQIRVHLTDLGFPIVGDGVYGSSGRDKRLPGKPTRQMLHAAELAFTHPVTGQPLAFTAPFPEDFARLVAG